MKRQISLEEISDGRLYGLHDMVKADCNGCEGCSACCTGMGQSIILDPYDIWRLTGGIPCSFEELLANHLELHVVDGVILPNLRMAGKEEACTFLDESGRCRIHAYRPGVCRLFPLGRYYEDHSCRYFLQVYECTHKNRTKVKVRKWMDTPDIKEYEPFILTWHCLLKDLEERGMRDARVQKAVNIYVLKQFFVKPYDVRAEFYPQFYGRLEETNVFLADL